MIRLLGSRARSNEHHEGNGIAPARAARLLPGARHAARVTRHDADIQRANIDAELQGVGADNGHDFALAEALFYLAAFRGEVTAPIAFDQVVTFAHLAHRIFEIGGKNFHPEAAPRKDDGLDFFGEERFRQTGGFLHR